MFLSGQPSAQPPCLVHCREEEASKFRLNFNFETSTKQQNLFLIININNNNNLNKFWVAIFTYQGHINKVDKTAGSDWVSAWVTYWQGPTGRGFWLRDGRGRVLAKKFGYRDGSWRVVSSKILKAKSTYMGDKRATDHHHRQSLLLGHWYEIMALYYVKSILTEISASRQAREEPKKRKII